MAGLDCFVSSGSQSLSANTDKTVLQLLAAANHRIKIKGYSLTIGGIIVKDIQLRVLLQTTAGTPGSTPTITKTTGADETVQTVAKSTFSAEPSEGNVLQHKFLQSSYEKIFPLGGELIIAGGSYVAISVKSVGDTASVVAEFTFEE